MDSMSWSLYRSVLRFSHAFRGNPRASLRDHMRLGATLGIPSTAAVAALLLIMIVEGCAATAKTAGASRTPPPPLPVAELLLVGFGGTQVEGNEEIHTLVCDIKVGGLILFERQASTGQPRNIVGPEQVHQLTSDLQALAMRCAGRPLFIAADNEGGVVMRLSTRAGYLPTPAPRALGEAGDVAATELEARRMAATLREAGINWNLAPVVDVAVNPLNPAVVTLGRTFSADPDRVIAHARAFILGMHEAGVLTSLKHFPGHGSSLKDSHLGFVDVTDTADLKLELQPYRALIKEGLADSVMTAHVFNRGIDPWNPATLSRFTIKRYLRGKLKYSGPVVSDDLLMGAIRQRYGVEEAAVLALQASVDILLISQNQGTVERGTAERVVAEIRNAIADGRLSRTSVSIALERVRKFRSRLNPRQAADKGPSAAMSACAKRPICSTKLIHPHVTG
jgi:beta-N-acetylhexosaminidase